MVEVLQLHRNSAGDRDSGSENNNSSSGFKFNFYKSNDFGSGKNTQRKLPQATHTVQRRSKRNITGINKGVSHKIKKPKAKPKQEKSRYPVRPPSHAKLVPRLPFNRSPRKSEREKGRAKRCLSSPGVSFIGSSHTSLSETPEKKIFTSRSRVAADVNINSKIKLSAQNGDVALKQKNALVPKKNIGRNEEKIHLTSTPPKRSCPDSVLESVTSHEYGDITFDLNGAVFDEVKPTRVLESPIINKFSSLKIPMGSPVRRSPRKCMQNRAKFGAYTSGHCASNCKSANKENLNSETPAIHSNELIGKKYFPIFYVKENRPLPAQQNNIRVNRSRKMKLFSAIDDNQMVIDAGQKEFGAKQCQTCGILYEVGHPADEAAHISFHDGFLVSLKYTGWKSENIVRELDHHGGRVVMITPKDGQHCWRKVEEIREVVDCDLGFVENYIWNKDKTYAYFYVLEKCIVGCLIAEKISKAYRILPASFENQASSHLDSSRAVVCCCEEPERAWAGVSRIWVLRTQRRKGIATLLLDAMRGSIFSPHYLSVDEFAFTDPTENGMAFAEKYVGKNNFLIYRRN